MAKVGRPSSYTQELADRICQELAMGYSLRTVCKSDDMPNIATVFRWMREHAGFSDQYAKAKQESTDAMAEDILDIADDGTNDYMEVDGSLKYNGDSVQRARLRVDTRRWLMAKMKPKKYGDKLELDGKVDSNITIQTVNYSPDDVNSPESEV